ncbi:hypothetical protein GDO86_012261 [Hymenochirus boettgeri]|uniref:Fish-egg lectin-like n=1 Tax=Hymenochirus boettgeri TaxID=247094 RepID=A0A8T2ILT9_9PIPI|nr:hypothetical protein GDO86_012261 [Hymenochirus boettgeri]
MLLYISLALLYTAVTADLQCTLIPGTLTQLDAGSGQVYGVNAEGGIFHWVDEEWVQVPGGLIHVTVGPAGVWGVNAANYIYKIQDNTWVQVSGLLKQIDAGGEQFIAGVNSGDAIYCVDQAGTTSRETGLPWINIAGGLKYYSCGPIGCWGVNSANQIFYRYSVSPTECQGSQWTEVEGSLTMIEVGIDGSVYGVAADGKVFRRDGICPNTPTGTTWTQLDTCGSFKHVSYDSGYLWLITLKGQIVRCAVPESTAANLL